MAVSVRAALADARASQVPAAAVRPNPAAMFALGRIEARKMLLHPSYWVAIPVLIFFARGLAGGGGMGGGKEEAVAILLAGLLVAILMGTILTANVAAVRQKRDHVGELFGSLPAPPEARTGGLFVGLLLGPLAVSLGITTIGWWVATHLADPFINPDEVDRYFIVQVPLAVFALGAMAIAVGRWVPSLFGGPAIIALHLFTGVLWAVPWIMPRSSGIDATWHLIYLPAAIVTWVALALARDRRTAGRFAVAGAAFILGVVAASLQAPPGGY